MVIEQYFLIFVVTTLAAFYGSIFGGAGFVLFPFLFLMGFEPKAVIATNTVSAIGLLLVSSFIYYKEKNYDIPSIKAIVPFAFLGALFGGQILIKANADLIKFLVSLVIVGFALFSVIGGKRMLTEVEPSVFSGRFLTPIFAFFIGIYNMTIAAGTGTLLAYLLVYLRGLSLKKSIMTRPFIGLPILTVAAIIFTFNGLVDWHLFFPMFFGWSLGSFFGAHTVIRANTKTLAIIFNVIVVLLALYNIFNL